MNIAEIAEKFKADNPDVEWSGDVEDTMFYKEYANPGFDSGIGVITANWNDFPRGFDSAVEAEGYVIDWNDEISSCDNCYRAIHTIPSFYGDTPSYAIVDECSIVCFECLKDEAESYLESLENNPRRAVNVRGIDPAEHGYVKLEGDFENGFHPGQNDNPETIYARLHSTHPRLLFVVDSTGQFDMQFSVWTKPAESEDEL